MKKSAPYGMAVLLALLSAIAGAADIEISSEGVSVSDDGVTSYNGDVTIRAPLGTPMKISAQSTREVNGAQVLEGDVRIVIEDMLITTQKATITRKDAIVIEMDEADSAPAQASAG